MRELHVSGESYSVTTTLSPKKIAALAGVQSLDFWEDEEELTEADFYGDGDDLKVELEKMSLNLIAVLTEQREKEERKEMPWEEEDVEKKAPEQAATEDDSDDDDNVIEVVISDTTTEDEDNPKAEVWHISDDDDDEDSGKETDSEKSFSDIEITYIRNWEDNIG